MRTERNINNIRTGSNKIRNNFLHIRNSITVLYALFSGNTDRYGKIISYAFAHRSETFHHEARATSKIATVFIGSLVGMSGKKLHQKIAMRTVQFHSIESGYLSTKRCFTESLNYFFYLLQSHFPRRSQKTVEKTGNRRRRYRLFILKFDITFPSTMMKLHSNLASLIMDSFS
ncbi:MAG: hypothetical protein BWY90_00689 [Deltaproteobacteria bacterium ADurb.BinA014]|nr:MAG: hypothetical protein BWY90_00689 [Deltaproteobacteria bacterium ADurb.BinA014]